MEKPQKKKQKALAICLRMGWLKSMISPFTRFWRRLHPSRPRRRRGIHMLYEDVMSCSCEDVHALWSMLVDSDANI
nr:unnamed protein product [Ipomoea trifida]